MNNESFPRLAITIDEVPLADAGGGNPLALSRLTVSQQLSLPTQCELVFSDPPGPQQAVRDITIGASLRISTGNEEELLFLGQVTAIDYVHLPSGQSEIRLRAYDPSHALRKRQPVRTHTQLNVQELAQEFVADLDLDVDAATTGPLQPRLIQYNQTDYDLLISQLEQAGLYYFVRDQTLHIFTLEGLTSEPIDLELGNTLFEARCSVNSDQAAEEIIATGWDSLAAEVYQTDQTQARTGRQVPVTVSAESVGGDSTRRLIDISLSSADQIEALAQAELDHRNAQTVTVWGVASGDPALFPGAPVMIQGVAEAVAGRYVLTRVTHTVDSELGFVSEFTSSPPAPKSRRANVVAALAAVIDVGDPDGLGRVRVSLPAYDNLETDWLYVIAPAAGRDKGLMMLPNTGDQVLVLFTSREPGQGIVIGGFYTPDLPYDTGVEDSSVQRYTLRTPGGHILRLDDFGHSLRLEDSHGSYVEMTPDKVRLFANTDLEISAPGRNIVIQSNAVDFRRG
jgi:phage protein D/phage baseplate assembly protein gpV